jgi:hypothetical protein
MNSIKSTFAIVFSVENKHEGGSPDISSTYEKMAIALSRSIRQCMPDVDVYCGCFTNNILSGLARKYFKQYSIEIIEDLCFDNIGDDDSYMFLRSFTKHYFATRLLDHYHYIVYVDVDVLFLRTIEFNFDPTSNICLVDTMPKWVVDFLSEYLITLDVPLLYNWFDVINKHNRHIFDLDYTDSTVLKEHMADIIVSKRIHYSNLQLIEQTVGGYHCVKPICADSIAYHYDSLGYAGTLYHLKQYHPSLYKQYKMFFETILNVPINNQQGYWEQIRDRYYECH